MCALAISGFRVARGVCVLSTKPSRPHPRRRAVKFDVVVSLGADGAEGPTGKEGAAWIGLVVATSAACLSLHTCPPASEAVGPVKIPLDDLQQEIVTCPPGTRAFGSHSQTRCLNIKARAVNGSNKTLYNVDVFGRVYDADGNNALDRDEASDAGRVTNIPKVSPGEQIVHFPLRVSEKQAKQGPLQFKSFKAVGYPGAAFSPLLDECTDEFGELQLGGECTNSEIQ